MSPLRSTTRLSLLALLLAGGCKNTEDYLSDIRTSQNDDGRLNLQVYDSGLLIHEGLTGLMEQDALTLSQMGRAVNQAGTLLDKNEIALIRADAVTLLAHIALRYPLPPIDSPYVQEKGVGDTAIKLIQSIEDDARLLDVELKIPALSSTDRVVVERAHHELKQLTGQSFPAEADPWESWWKENRERVVGEVETKSREPLRTLAGLRYGSLSNARAVLGYLAVWLRAFDLTALRADFQAAIVRIARQVVVFGIQKAIRDPDPVARIAAIRAAAAVLDPSFGDTLLFQFQREADPETRAQIVSALRFYPGSAALGGLLLALQDHDAALRIHARRTLTSIVGEDLGPGAGPWQLWYERDGKSLWR